MKKSTELGRTSQKEMPFFKISVAINPEMVVAESTEGRKDRLRINIPEIYTTTDTAPLYFGGREEITQFNPTIHLTLE
jgi:hypothetical protein